MRSSRIAVALALGLVVSCGNGPPPALMTPTRVDPPSTSAVSERLVVHVAGWVKRPGLVELAPGGRVADAVAAAGGALPGADLSALNLAAPLRDGDQVRVPAPGEAVVSGTGGGGEEGPVDVNRAGASELERLPGVGPVLAERIVAYRDEHGPFATAEDLLDVPGIGEAKLAGLRDAITLP